VGRLTSMSCTAASACMAGLLGGHHQEAPGTVVISAIDGTAGVGKTALAVHWAHHVVDRFPDGQLYVNLRGYDPGQPMPATDALAGFLQSLGVPGQDIPAEADQRAARYRSLTAGKRMLIVLDNAGSADQVRPLLPGTPSCTVVVTSRDALAGLVARDGATRVDLDLLPLEDAVALLRTMIGARADAEPRAAAELAGQCCRLPLALRVAAELAAIRPATSLAELADELAHLGTRLDLLRAGGDSRTEVRAVFSWSYRHLDADAARTFRLLARTMASPVTTTPKATRVRPGTTGRKPSPVTPPSAPPKPARSAPGSPGSVTAPTMTISQPGKMVAPRRRPPDDLSGHQATVRVRSQTRGDLLGRGQQSREPEGWYRVAIPLADERFRPAPR
jgi:hypothetical protein